MATDIACALMIEGEHGYMTAKTANESKDGKAKEACLYFTFFSMAGLVELRAILATRSWMPRLPKPPATGTSRTCT